MTQRLLPEDPAERDDFDRACVVLEQTPLERVAQTLFLWSEMAPAGSYSKDARNHGE